MNEPYGSSFRYTRISIPIKINSDEFILLEILVRVEGVGPSSHPWEGYIIAVIRYPLIDIL